jgi:hypothetical protein
MRNGQNAAADPAAPSMAGWTWQRADGTILGSLTQRDQQAFHVANGFIGICGRGDQVALCTSADGLHWMTPADPAIVVTVGSRQFMPHHVVRFGSVWIALDWGGPVLWRSTDGVHWSQVDSPALRDLSLGRMVAVLANGFVVEASENATSENATTITDFAFTSTDGLTWTRSSQFPVSPMYTPDSGPMRLVVGGDMSDSATGQVWQTLDGKTWTPVQLPGVWLADAYSLADGGFVGWGWKTTISTSTPAENSAGLYHILRSTDGVSWRVDQGDLQGEPCSLVVVADRLFAGVLPACDTAPQGSVPQGWQSSDSGRTWQPVMDGTGQQMSGRLWRMGDRATISSWVPETSAWRLAWVGTPTSSTP